MTVIERMAEWAVRMRLGDVPARVVERARLQQASTDRLRELTGIPAAEPVAA